MNSIFLVGLGGFIGAVARFKIGGFIMHHTTDWKFPLSTFVVNFSGCLVAGILSGLTQKHDFFEPNVRLFLFTGLLGGFTTFSAFGLETVALLQRNELFLAGLNITLSVLCGLSALWLGLKVIPS